MNDLISRQAAIDELGDEPEVWTESEYELGMQNQWQSDIDALKALPSAQPEPQWIPCSERLPDEEDTYLVMLDTSNLFDDEIQVTDAYWINNQWQYGVLESYEHRMPKLVIEPCEELKVTAWMPLPEPYKGEES